MCGSQSRTVHYEPIVKKLSEYLENLEFENGFLSNNNSKHELTSIMKQLLNSLNSTGKFNFSINIKL